MTLTLDNIVRGDVPPADARKPERRIALIETPASRRTFVKGLIGAGIATGLYSLQMFPLVRPAFADGYDIYPYTTSGPCTSYAASHDCSPGCGPSTICGTSPGSGCCNANGWHLCCGALGPNGAIHYLRPNECWSGGYDGWNWRCDASTLYRCHDGTACYNGGCGNTICRHTNP